VRDPDRLGARLARHDGRFDDDQGRLVVPDQVADPAIVILEERFQECRALIVACIWVEA
jgi:hypothetical protein